MNTTIDLYGIWTELGESGVHIMYVWVNRLEDAQRIAYMLDGVAVYEFTGVVRPD